MYDKLVAKVNNINTSGLVKKTDYDTKITETKDKIPNSNSFVKKTDYNIKITETEGKTPDIISLATKTALTSVEKKIPSITGLVKKQTIMLRLLILKMNLTIIIMINMLSLQSLIL